VWLGGELLAVGLDSGLVFRLTLDGRAEVLAAVGGGPNGAAVDAGVVYVAQSGGQAAVSRRWPGVTGGVQTISAGRVASLNDDLVAPNDLCFGPDGRLYVTDPTRGPRPARDGRLWRLDPATGAAVLLQSAPWHINGIGFDKAGVCYLADTFGRRVVRIEFDEQGWPRANTTFASWDAGLPDGLQFGKDGRLYVCLVGEHGAAAELLVLDATGQAVEREPFPESETGPSDECTNIAIRDDGLAAVTDSTTGTILVAQLW
jgi:gluconolactonase